MIIIYVIWTKIERGRERESDRERERGRWERDLHKEDISSTKFL
jgi:hypothetical protein